MVKEPSKMKIYIKIYILLLLVLLCALEVSGRKGKRRGSVIKHARSTGSFEQKPRVNKGRVDFNREEYMAVEIDGRRTRSAKLKKMKDAIDNPKLALKNKDQVAVYADVEEGVFCRKECDANGDCDKYCSLNTDNETCFVSADTAVCTKNDPDVFVDTIMPSQEESMVTDPIPPASRRRRSVVPKLDTVGFIRVVFHLDDAFMDVFKTIAGEDATAGITEATKYIKLLANEMTYSFQTLKEYGLSYTLAGETYPMDLAIYVANIVFPEISGNNYINVPWSARSVNSEGILENGLTAFTDYLRDEYNSLVGYDHQAGLSGYEFSGGTIGKAYLSKLCRKSKKTQALSLSVRYGMLARLVAHEVAHSIGINHDSTSGCATTTYVMSSSITYPTSSTRDTYYKFSRCSAGDVQSFLSSITTSDVVEDCLFDPSITNVRFLGDFCLGFRGNDMTYDETCKAAYGPGSRLCSTIPATGVTKCLAHSGYKCINEYGNCVNLNDIPPGTRCSTDGTATKKICYGGRCSTIAEICPTTQVPTDGPTGSPTSTQFTLPPVVTMISTTLTTKSSTSAITESPTTSTVTTSPTSTTTKSSTSTVTTSPGCVCNSKRCCRRSSPPCCDGCSENRFGRCKARMSMLRMSRTN